MGILNLTPDSFSDGGEFDALSEAQKRILEMMKEGAGIIDIGGESTGPGSMEVSEQEELERVKPIIDWVAEEKLTDKILFSLDTYKASVAEYGLERGFQMINDVTALRGDPKMLDTLLRFKPYVVLMYSKDSTARTTKEPIEYEDVVKTVSEFLVGRAELLFKAGFPPEKIILDPGMGSFVSAIPDYSFELINRLPELKKLAYPILIGISRKSCLGGKLEERDQPTVEWSLEAIKKGASIVRIHAVAKMRDALNLI